MTDNSFKKSVEDEVDLKLIDQLHASTLNFSSTSTELKKILFVLIGIVIPTIIKLSNNSLDISLFIAIFILLFTFWFLDSFTNYYQVKLRLLMDIKFRDILRRNNVDEIKIVNYKLTIDIERGKGSLIWKALFHSSIYIYIILIFLNAICLLLFNCKKIG